MKICICVGTRPEIIKMSPLLRLCESKGVDHFLLHTGQHYSYNMDKVFFEELSLPAPAYNLNSGVEGFGLQIGTMIRKIQTILLKEKPDIILLEGDTNSVLAGALAASKGGIKIGHVEAGLRSFDISMAEELNRILTDHLSEYLFAPTEASKKNMLDEGIEEGKIFVTGNTIVDAVRHHRGIAKEKSTVLQAHGLEKEKYFLITLHRQECVDDRRRLASILRGFEKLSALGLPLVYPIHPRTRKMLKAFGLEEKMKSIPNLRLLEPLGYFDFLTLEAHARAVLTDAGGVQEEACIFNVPCVTLRENTERPETLAVGSNLLAGYKSSSILASTKAMLKKDRNWENPFGDGKAAEKILDIILDSAGK